MDCILRLGPLPSETSGNQTESPLLQTCLKSCASNRHSLHWHKKAIKNFTGHFFGYCQILAYVRNSEMVRIYILLQL